jgi:hypothetical protein
MRHPARRLKLVTFLIIFAVTLSACATAGVASGSREITKQESYAQEFAGSNGDGSLTIINYTDYSTDMIMDWGMSASGLMADQDANVLIFLYPVGMPTGQTLEFGDFGLHDVVMTPENQGALLADIELWLRADDCVDEKFFDPTSDQGQGDEFAMWRDWVEQGADASTMRILCSTTRVVAMGITPQLVWEGELELERFLAHELYHAFQQDLDMEGDCSALSEDEATANTPWMAEGGAHYFSSFLTGVVKEDGIPKEGEVGENERIRMEILRDASRAYKETPGLHESGPDRKGAAALLRMVDKGLITHEEIMDGSFFHNCARELRYPSGGPEIQEIRNDWYSISAEGNRYAFDG